jgi:hypothetical protein
MIDEDVLTETTCPLEMLNTKNTNPKDAIGTRKAPMSTVPANVLKEVGVGMMEGSRKYGRHNYRVAGIRASVYYDATQRHMMDWWEGEDLDPDSGLSHITKGICSLIVLRDAMLNDKMTDDRPPSTDISELRNTMQNAVDDIFRKYPTSPPAYVRSNE